jgi:hypothetical protein
MSILRIPALPARGSFAARTLGTFALTAAAAGGFIASAGTAHADAPTTYTYTTINNSNDLTFNQLLGINDNDVIAGYFGSGMAGHPNKGYYLLPGQFTQLDYRVENFPGSTQTQVTGLNDNSTEVGFQSPTNTGTDADYGWYSLNNGRTFTQVNVPLPSGFTPASTPVTQLLGVNDQNIAVGFENDSNNNAHGFVYSIGKGLATFTNIPDSSSVTDAGVNDRGQIAGFFNPTSGAPSGVQTEGFVIMGGTVTALNFPDATVTMALGVNNHGEVVGSYMDSTGTHGFTWTKQGGFVTIDDVNGIVNGMSSTTVNGVNDQGDLVGFYTDANGNTDGMLVTPNS